MDLILDAADKYVFDGLYEGLKESALPAAGATLHSALVAIGLDDSWATLTPDLEHFLNASGITPNRWADEAPTATVSKIRAFTGLAAYLERDSPFRQALTLGAITLLFAHVVYFLFASISYYFVFDRSLERHPRFLKNQIRKEIITSVKGFPLTTLVTVPWFLGEVRGYSRLYDRVDEYGWAYAAFSAVWFLVFTDAMIYLIHRWLHYPTVYRYLHKLHHKWLVPTPFASHAFHPLDGYVQSVPYHVFIYLFPMHKYLYLGMFTFVNLWTVAIHSGYMPNCPLILNGPGHHTVHHMDFNYNYGQYLTWMDRLGNTYREPRDEAVGIEARDGGKKAQ